MSQELINIGQSANDKSGDSIRLAFLKCNNNFGELYASLGNSVVPAPSAEDANYILSVNSDGTGYQLIAPTSITNLVLAATPPVGNPNTLWYDDVGGRLYVYYQSHWVEASPPLGQYKPIPPTSAQGASGDVQGEWSADANYYYFCTATWQGLGAVIWKRIAFDTNNAW
jgi:hypothetical protein